jgi:hypothetical protein
MAIKKSLMGWVNSRWKVKGQVDLKLGSKGFFTTIFSNLRIEIKYLRKAHIFSTQQASIYATRPKYLLQRKRTSWWL